MSIPSENIIEWYIRHKRDLPWRNSRSPYHIWLSEIILQQTRINQGIHYYMRFIDKYPDIESLAAANLDDILKLWQGLGYYSRARNMHATARAIVEDHLGKFPSTYKGLLKLKGIGPYTAAAIASIAFDIPVAVVDGNVFRVLARLFNEGTIINSTKGKSVFKELADSILDPTNPGMHNQALMELGSQVCRPKNPLCNHCPLSSNCKASLTGRVHDFPVKTPRNPVKPRFFNYLFITCNHKIFISRRNGRDIWNSLYEFPLIETPVPVSKSKLITLETWKEIMKDMSFQIMGVSKTYRHQLTHQLIHATFYRIKITSEMRMAREQWISVEPDQLKRFAIPRLIERYLQDLKLEIED